MSTMQPAFRGGELKATNTAISMSVSDFFRVLTSTDDVETSQVHQRLYLKIGCLIIIVSFLFH